MSILEVKNLSTSFFTDEGEVKAVDDVSFAVEKGETLGIVGESGCGKSVACLSVLRLIPSPPGKILSGEILYSGKDLLKFNSKEMQKVRGNEISMVFQDPMTSLNPVFTIGEQIGESIALHQKLSKKEVRARTIEMLDLVGIASSEKRIADYPHQLSGGMRQRVMIAMALSCNPAVLIADEPTTALDVTVQAQILELLKELQKKVGLAIILITHDLGVVAEVADNVVVMYAGRVVEEAPVKEIFTNPQHPYTRGLLNSIPKFTPGVSPRGEKKRLEAIPGIVPNLSDLPPGCRFHDRCSFLVEKCRNSEPALRACKGDTKHKFRCLRDL
ncbi:MAG: peptide ABC transporter ATP-binding protein [Bdellovibrionales bacterium RIFOXYD1_FULL_44_7]|nr:MAG: peptide ABC transporter ATP-binding protein [Bdellovibrionales bacterium RIFOXYD1_FULL_44_7]